MTCKRIKITVTQQHIDDGEPGSRASCPIALAVEETLAKGFPSFVKELGVCVDGEVEIGGNIAKTSAPARIEKFVEMFDKTQWEENARMPKPFSFYLE